METDTLKTQRTDLQHVDHRNIIVEENFNKRGLNNYGDMEGLALNVVANGVIDAIIGFKVRGEDRFVLTEGHRRLKAVKMAFKYHAEGKAGFEDISKIELIPLRPASSDKKERLIIMATTGFGKVALTEMEKASLYLDLIEIDIKGGMKRGEAIKALVGRLGISQATVYNILKLNEFPDEIKEEITNGTITGSTVVALVRDVKEEVDQIRIVKEAIAEVKTVAQTEGKEAKKVTAKNVKSLKAKTPMQKMKDVIEKLGKNEVNNIRVRTLTAMVELLENKGSVKEIYELFE